MRVLQILNEGADGLFDCKMFLDASFLSRSTSTTNWVSRVSMCRYLERVVVSFSTFVRAPRLIVSPSVHTPQKLLTHVGDRGKLKSDNTFHSHKGTLSLILSRGWRKPKVQCKTWAIFNLPLFSNCQYW